MSEKWRRSEICIVIYDKSQGSMTKPLRCNVLLYYTFIIQSAGERIFTIGTFGEVTDKRIVFCFVLFSDSRVVAKFEEQTQQQQQQQPQY